ncbi:hypothetical protein GQ54DRAFT_308429 [Martensiomyces pterosporus]|nr:hypothetical protein GQ54DRAFT_308429 [Martensiomyces pterosporus]
MYHRSGSAQAPESIGRLIGMLAQRRAPSPPGAAAGSSGRTALTAQPSPKQPPQQPADDDAAAVPELLKPCVQRYSARWTAAQKRHDQAMRKCKNADARLESLYRSVQTHAGSAQSLASELSLLPDTRLRLESVRSQIDDIKTALASLEQLYGALADANTAWKDDLAQQESRFRQSRRTHYLGLQQSMDQQYAELRQDSVRRRAANAALSFQRDLENYQSSRPLPRKPNPERVRIADVVLLPPSWDDSAKDFFSDGEDGISAGTAAPGKSPPACGRAGKSSSSSSSSSSQSGDADGEPSGFSILPDEDFE